MKMIGFRFDGTSRIQFFLQRTYTAAQCAFITSALVVLARGESPLWVPSSGFSRPPIEGARIYSALSAAYSLISGWDTEVKQYNSCLLRPLPRPRVHRRRHYCRPPLSRKPDLHSSSLSLFLSTDLLCSSFPRILSWYVNTHRRNDATAFITDWHNASLYLFPFWLLSLLLSLLFFRWFSHFLRLRPVRQPRATMQYFL